MKRKKGVTRRLIESLAKGESDLHHLASNHGMSHIDMARWVERPRHAELLRLLENLQNRRMSLLLAAARADAAESLRKMAIEGTPKETARKACVDLLKLQRERDSPGASSADGAGEAELAEDAYSALNRVLADIPAGSRSHPASDHDTNDADSSFDTASTAPGGTISGQEIQSTSDNTNGPQSRTHDDRQNTNEPADADDAERTA